MTPDEQARHALSRIRRAVFADIAGGYAARKHLLALVGSGVVEYEAVAPVLAAVEADERAHLEALTVAEQAFAALTLAK